MLGVVALLAVPALALGQTAGQAASAARRAANAYTNRAMGIGGSPGDWTARCSRLSSSVWRCGVKFNAGECRGTLRLRNRPHEAFRAYKYEIGCEE